MVTEKIGSILSPSQKVELHKAYWLKEPLKRPLFTFHLADDFFFSQHYKAAEKLLFAGKKITPDMLDVDLFLERVRFQLRVDLLFDPCQLGSLFRSHQ